MGKNYEYNADFIAKWMKRKGITKAEFQSRMAMTAQSYYRWVENKTNSMPLEYIIKFCNMFDEDISNFFLLNGESVKVEPRGAVAARRARKEEEQQHQNRNDSITKEELLEMKLQHTQELQQMQKEAHDRETELLRESRRREDELRKEYEERIDECRQREKDSMECMKMALAMGSERQIGQMPHVLDEETVKSKGLFASHQ